MFYWLDFLIYWLGLFYVLSHDLSAVGFGEAAATFAKSICQSRLSKNLTFWTENGEGGESVLWSAHLWSCLIPNGLDSSLCSISSFASVESTNLAAAGCELLSYHLLALGLCNFKMINEQLCKMGIGNH